MNRERKKVYLVSACRTPIGKMGGALSELPVADLGAIVIKEAIKRSGVSKNMVDHVCMGCVIQAGMGQNLARQAAIKAGLPYTTTAETLNLVCGSGLESVNSAARLIQMGEADTVVAGGMENMSMAPFAIMNARYGYKMGSPMVQSEMLDTMVYDALWDSINNHHMGITAENIAAQWNLSRKELDEFAAESQQKALHAHQTGAFDEEIVPVMVKTRTGEQIIDTDENLRPDTTVETLSKLSPAFKSDGIVTAGNSSTINDGAAAVVLMSEDKANELGITPMAEWLGSALCGVDPTIMGIGPVASTHKLLNKLNMTITDIDLIEVNEAFASQSIAVQKELHFPKEKLNANGGAIALGHPVGASGCRILVTLLYAMKRRNAKTGLATLCIGGGMGCSTIVSTEI